MIVNNIFSLTLTVCRAQTGRLSGQLTLPVERTATAGFATLIVAPNGYKKDNALKNIKHQKLRIKNTAQA